MALADSIVPFTVTYKLLTYLLLTGKRAKDRLTRDQPLALLTLVLNLTLAFCGPPFGGSLLAGGGVGAGSGLLPSSETTSLSCWNVGHSSPQREVSRHCQQHFASNQTSR